MKEAQTLPIAQRDNAVYAHIGQRIRERRKLLKLSQADLAELMGFSYQQMQKYESGASQVSAGKLLMFARILNVPPSFFYEGISLKDRIGKRIESDIIQTHRTTPLHLLLIEDNPTEVIMFKRALRACSEPAEMQIIHDPETALKSLLNYEMKFNRRQPDVIVLDLSMPRLPGIELLKLLKKNPQTREFPVIVLTNSVNVKDMIESYRQGAAGFIHKSVDLKEYAESLDVIVKYWSKTVALPCA